MNFHKQLVNIHEHQHELSLWTSWTLNVKCFSKHLMIRSWIIQCHIFMNCSWKIHSHLKKTYALIYGHMWRNSPKSGGMRWEGSARNPKSRITLPFLEQCYHFEILTSINTLTCFISSSLVQFVKKKSLFVYFVWFIRALSIWESQKN